MTTIHATETPLVEAESNHYDRALDGIIALGIVSFVLGLLAQVSAVGLETGGEALVDVLLGLLAATGGGFAMVAIVDRTNVIPVESARVRGVGVGILAVLTALSAVSVAVDWTLATLLGSLLVVMAVGIVVAGIASRVAMVDTAPDETTGLVAGTAFGAIGLMVGGAIGGSFVGFDSPLWLVLTVVGGGALFAITVLPREDLGSTLAPGLVVAILGLTIVTATIGVGWEWNPDAISGGFTGGSVIPLFVITGAIVSSWAAAKSRAGFGARGREYGALLVINLNAALMLAVMVAIVVFVTVKGVGYAFHGFSIGGLTGIVLSVPALVFSLAFAREPAGTSDWHTGTRQLFRLAPLAVVGALVGLLTSVFVRGPLTYAYQYIVYVNRQPKALDTRIAITSDPLVDALVLAFAGGLLSVYFYRRFAATRSIKMGAGGARRIRQGIVGTVALNLSVSVLVFVLGPASGVGALGVPLVLFGSLLAGTLVAVPVGARLVGVGLDEAVFVDHGRVTSGFLGALSILASTLVLHLAIGPGSRGGPTAIVPAVAVAGTVLSVLFVAGQTAAHRPAASPAVARRRANHNALALTGATGFVTIAALQVWLTGTPFDILGITLSPAGTISWPMTMQAYIPLGAEPGGIMPAVVGTVWLVIGSTLFAIPLGVGAAVFLTEYAEEGRFTTVVEVATNALWSTPSVVFGLFGAAFLIPRLGGDTSLLAGMLVLGFMLLPLVLITSREAILAVPDEYRDASAALGATRWQTIRSVVLPAAMPGVITGGILGVGRIAGETAPLILVLGSTLNATESVHVLSGFRFVSHPPFVANDQLLAASASLPTQVWAIIAAGVSGSPSMGWATAFVLLVVVLSFYAIGIAARTYFRRKIDDD